MDDSLPPQVPPTLNQSATSPASPAVTPPVVPPQPPPFLPPPPLTPPPAPKRRSGIMWMIIAIVALVFLGIGVILKFLPVLGNFTAMEAASGMDRNQMLQEFYLERHGSEKIVVIDVEGIITGRDLDRSGMGMVEYVAAQLRAAERDSYVKAVILKVNSPGGEVLAADEIYRAIEKFQLKTGKPVVVSMGSLAASGGYYISAPCRWIVANELTMTGSIGVIMHGYNYRGLMDKVGVRPMVFKSGQFKDMLSGDQEPDINKLTPEQRETRLKEEKMVQDLINETYTRFKTIVEAGRKSSNEVNGKSGHTLVENWADYADGRVFSGKQALDLGFVDELGNFEVAVHRTETLAGTKGASLVQYRQPFSLGSLFGLLGKTEAPSIKVDLGVDSPKLRPGYMYYISPMLW